MLYVDYAVNQRLCLSKRNCLSLSERYSIPVPAVILGGKKSLKVDPAQGYWNEN